MSSAATTTESTSVQQRPDLLPPDKSVSQWQTAPGKLHKFTDLNQRPAETGEDRRHGGDTAANEIMSLLGEMKRKPHKQRYEPPPKGFYMRYSGRYTSI